MSCCPVQITQMKFRLSEGSGECFYYLGVEDDGYPRGLESQELQDSVAVIHRMAVSLQVNNGQLAKAHAQGPDGIHQLVGCGCWRTAVAQGHAARHTRSDRAD